jgi:uracil-DNA glycosylase
MVYRSWRCTETVPGWDLDFFASKEWLDVQDKLDELEAAGFEYNPARVDIFRSLLLSPFDNCSVCICGQDPYPNKEDATGVAFECMREEGDSEGKSRVDLVVNGGEKEILVGNGQGVSEVLISKVTRIKLPSSLYIIYKELVANTGQPWPTHGCLESWCRQGVLLWNVIPVYMPYKSSRRTGETINYFSEWNKFYPLTQEIIERLSIKGKMVFVFCGRKAQEYARYVDPYNNRTIYTSHPSPRGQINAENKFIGSKLFNNINASLIHYLKEPIDWRL